MMWSNATIALSARYRQSGLQEDLDALIDATRLAAAGLSGVYRAGLLQNLSDLLLTRYQKNHVRADLDGAVEALSQSESNETRFDPDRMVRWRDLADALMTRYDERRNVIDVDKAIDCFLRGLAALASEDRRGVALLVGLALARYELYQHTGDMSDLDGAVDAAEQAVVTGDCGWEGSGGGEARARLALAAIRDTKADHAGGLVNHELAVRAARLAIIAVDGGDQLCTALGMLAQVLIKRSQVDGDSGILADGLATARRAITVANSDDEQMMARTVLCMGLRVRGDLFNDADALSECVRILREVVAGGQLPELIRTTSHNELAAALRAQYLQFGVDTLDESVDIRRRLVTSARGPVDVAIAYSNLARALRDRYTRTGNVSDLTETLTALRDALNVFPNDVPIVARNRSDLVSALHAYYLRIGDPVALDEAVDVGRRAVVASDGADANRALMMANLAHTMILRYRHTGVATDLREALDYARRAANTTPIDRPERAQRLHDLGSVYRTAFKRSADPHHLSETVACFRAALAAISNDHPFRATIMHNLAETLVVASTGTDAEALMEAAACCRTSMDHASASVFQRCMSAHLLGTVEFTRGEWSAAVTGYRKAVELLPRLVTRAQHRPDQEYRLGGVAGLPQEAAAAALNASDVEAALTLLEGSRGVLLAQAIETRSDFTSLRERQPRLADRLEALRAELGSEATTADNRHRADGEWHHVVSEIRRLPEFKRFLLPPSIDELRSAAFDGAIVAITAHSERSDALIVTPDGVEVVALAGVCASTLAEQVRAFRTALAFDEWGADDQLLEVLSWLWESIAHPVLTKLRLHAADKPARRLWWCPSGLSTALPLHAAGHHVPRLAPGRKTIGVHDQVMSSYTPTIRALLDARQNLRPHTPHHPLVVAMPHTPTMPDLPRAGDEAHTVTRRLGGAPPLIGEAATRERVLDRLIDATWVHLACHASQDDMAPSNSALHLHDGRLSVLDIVRARRVGPAQFAYLSACSTAHAGLTLPDEAIHISSAFQLAGYPHVVGTMWPIADKVACDIADDVYKRLDGQLRYLAEAVHSAVTVVRDKYRAHPRLWAAHIHIGP
jgi:tetratricopeptide (TPR) repeat protein